MDLQLKGTELYIDLDKKEDAQGLFAVLNSRPDMVSEEVYKKGMFIYSWIFEHVRKLNDGHETQAALPYKKKPKKGK